MLADSQPAAFIHSLLEGFPMSAEAFEARKVPVSIEKPFQIEWITAA
jgi:hypothetical protein